MNMKIAFGIFCFGEEYYYKGAVEKINQILDKGFHCFVLTENTDFFNQKYTPTYVHVIPYDRTFKSYYDKMVLPKHILKKYDVCILIDADTYITDYSFIDKLKKYEFKDGITYIDTLLNHKSKKQFIHELNLNGKDWSNYNSYANQLYPDFTNFELMWEYFLVINKNGFNELEFYKHYEKLQLVKEFSDLNLNKEVNGCGEGISIQIASKLSQTTIQRDQELCDLISDSMVSVSRRFTPQHLWPSWMK